MIDDLKVAKSAQFFQVRKRITDKAIQDMFRSVRAQAQRPANNLFEHVREDHNGIKWSAICFAYERNPGFLDPPPNVRERLYGFLLIVEHQGKLAIIKSGLDLTAKFKLDYVEKVDAERVEAALSSGNAIFEKIRLRNMGLSRHVLRSKTLESEDLRNVVGPSGSNRYAPQGFALRRDDEHYSSTPSTGRIAQRSDSVGHGELIEWCSAMIEALNNQGAEVAPFLRTFARSVSLETYGARLTPTVFAVNTARLAEALLNPEPPFRLYRTEDENAVALTHAEMTKVVELLATNLGVRKSRGELRLEPLEGARRAFGKIRINKARITLLSLSLGGADALWIERTDNAVGQGTDAQSLRSYLNHESCFILLFDDVAFSYIDGRLYRDDQFASGGEELLRYLIPEPELAGITSEKGEATAAQTAFDPDCVFGVVATHIARADDVFVCDDLNDEWADFIGVNTAELPPTITFYHAKHKELGLGASPFHDAVGQGIKNLGNMMLPAEEIPRKIGSWNDPYRRAGVTTSIDRVMRGQRATLEAKFAEVRAAPDVIRRAYIVTSSLSKRQVREALEQIRAGNSPSPHFVQLYALLLSFVSACAEVGAIGRIICQE